MTKKELSQLYYLNREIEEQQRRLAELEALATSCSAQITGMPKVQWNSDKVAKYAAEIAELEALATSCSAQITGMPKVQWNSDKVAKYAAEIADLKALLDLNLKKCFYEFNRLNRYIETVDDSQMRMILALRYINGLSWRQIAFSIGGGNTEESIRQMVHRFFKKNSNK